MTIDRDLTDLGLSPTTAQAPHHCRNGWAGTDDRPTPCPICKPHLRPGPDGTWRINRHQETR